MKLSTGIFENNMRNLDTFGSRLCKIRKDKDLSQKQFADILGYKSNTTISNLESNNATPDIDTLVKIADYFQIDLHWLITGHRSILESHSNVLQTALKHIIANITAMAEKQQRMVHVIKVLSNARNSDRVSQKLESLKRELPRFEQRIKEAISDYNYVNQLIENQSKEKTE